MKIEPFTSSDIPNLKPLQPEGWLPLGPYYEFYVNAPFCHPVKYTIHGTLAGIGCAIRHRTTGWLAHIIVSHVYRRQGIGKLITKWLMDFLINEYKFTTLHLAATPMGAPLYLQLGFRPISDYVFMRDGKINDDSSTETVSFSEDLREAAFAMDRAASFEDRSALLEPHLVQGRFVRNNGKLEGYYLPTLGEGYIVASRSDVGLALIRLKHRNGGVAVAPEENREAMRYLAEHGYTEYRRGTRMIYGEPLPWRPDMIYARIGGNLG